MSIRSYTPHSPLTQLNYNEWNDGDDTPSQPLSGPGTSRQSRRLQLRNAGFRGAALPTRKVTPKSMSSSNWSSASAVNGASDVENVSPLGTRKSSANRRRSSGILQEIGNSSFTQPKRARQSLTYSKPSIANESPANAVNPSIATSPPPAKSTVRRRSVKARAKMSHPRRSLSGETAKYIEHLEIELASTQSQLSSITSPTVMRQQSSKVRSLNAETRQLQEEIAEWEAKYESRVQEEIDSHFDIENELRAQVRSLEQDAEETRFRVQELEVSLQCTTENLQAVETAKVNLERRVEIMSELLASSKVDLHVQTPGQSRKHTRPKSMLPRFPTASSLTGSPERQPRTQPASPLLTFTSHIPSLPSSPSHSILPLDNSPEHTDYTSEAESVFSEASIAADSMTSAENFDNTHSFNPWSLPFQQHAKSKPARRMRRFGAGSFGPKPLILPSTSRYEQFPPASAPPLERSETEPAFFPLRAAVSDIDGSPMSGRRRASTEATELTLAKLTASPFLDLLEQDVEESMIGGDAPDSVESHATTRHFSSFGSAAGRNLMDELCAARSEDTAESALQSIEHGGRSDDEHESEDDPSQNQRLLGDVVVEHLAYSDDANADAGIPETTGDSSLVPSPPIVAAPGHHRSQSRSISIPAAHSTSIFSRVGILFGDLWRSPVAMARYLVQTAQARMRIPRPLVSVQWWLVGVLLGPMARRRMLTSANGCTGADERSLLLDRARSEDQEDCEMAYGTWYETPPPSPGGQRTSNAIARSRKQCAHHRRKHSPWLWIKFSITLAFAIGTAFKDGPGSLLKPIMCGCRRTDSGSSSRIEG